jgi:hypothetical protein
MKRISTQANLATALALSMSVSCNSHPEPLKNETAIVEADSDSVAMSKYLVHVGVFLSGQQRDAILEVCASMRATGKAESDLQAIAAKRASLLKTASDSNHSGYELHMLLMRFANETHRCFPR